MGAAVVVALLGIAGGASAVAYWLAYRNESRSDRVLGLLYHRFVTDEEYERCPPTEKIISIPEKRFREQMEYLVREGYHAVSLQQVVEMIEKGTALPPKPVLITFDDW